MTYSLLTPSPLFILGVAAVASGAILRVRCFKALGQFFTFELSIHPSHTLVTTGPYSVVRHPSYTGIYLTLLGGTLVGLSPGTWLYERWIHFPALFQDIQRVGIWIMSIGSTYSDPVAKAPLPAFGDDRSWASTLGTQSRELRQTANRLRVSESARAQV